MPRVIVKIDMLVGYPDPGSALAGLLWADMIPYIQSFLYHVRLRTSPRKASLTARSKKRESILSFCRQIQKEDQTVFKKYIAI